MAMVLCFVGSAAADHTSIYKDPLGDVDGFVPDVTRVRVISGLDGSLLFGTQVANRTSLEHYDGYSFFLDLDRNPDTPDDPDAKRGSEVWILVTGFGDDEVDVYPWDDDLGNYDFVSDLPAEFGFGAGAFAEIPFEAYGLSFGDRIDFSIQTTGLEGDPDDAPDGDDTYSFQLRRCDLEGTRKDDRLTSGVRGDWICGFGGDDRLRGRGGPDLIYGGRGADRMSGGPEVDVLEGGRGDDRIRAGSGSDYIDVGGGGTDTVRCGAGFDEVDADASDEVFGCEDRY